MPTSDDTPDHITRRAPFRALERLAFIVGSVGLLTAMCADALAVLGRHVGLPLLGSIEVVQASVVLLASAAMLGTTLRDKHARAHLLTDRLSERGQRLLLGCSDAISAVLFLWFAAGSIWIAFELRHGHEHSELLHIPWGGLRLVWIASALLIAIVFAARVLQRNGARS
ncbi:TRAP transporter small permease subunit [Povalibacter sp.]|uniref:TRAP transporter small permease subunit n=1 Tax=Povalibacter sp. TaxID=1962978 RepID=UPI002F3F269F